MGSVAAGPALLGLSAYLPGPNLTAWIAAMCLGCHLTPQRVTSSVADHEYKIPGLSHHILVKTLVLTSKKQDDFSMAHCDVGFELRFDTGQSTLELTAQPLCSMLYPVTLFCEL